MRNIQLTLAAALGLAALSCVPRFGDRPPLAFSEFRYAGPDGRDWPVAMHELPETARTYGLRRPLRVAYVDLDPAGPKGTLVFVHGLGSYLKFWWYQLDAFAAEGWRVVALDLPGYGKSEKPGDRWARQVV
jgi:pimeloyl-ACP methyl ester carboxylesterase